MKPIKTVAAYHRTPMTLTRAMGGEVPMPFDSTEDETEAAAKSRWPPQDKGKAMPKGGYL